MFSKWFSPLFFDFLLLQDKIPGRCLRPSRLSVVHPGDYCQKSVEGLVERADGLLRELPDHHLVLIGSGPLESHLRSLATRQPSANRIHLIGWQPHAVTWMNHTELLLLPALYEDMPNVILEAMSVGCPFVAFDIDGIRQLLGDQADSTFQVVAPGDFDSLQAHAHALLDSPTLRQACSKFNQARITHHFQLSQQLEKYQTLYAPHAHWQLGNWHLSPYRHFTSELIRVNRSRS